MKLEDFEFEASPVTFWDVFGEQGHPVRTTVSEMGPLLFSRLLNLNDTQTGVLSLVFKIADDHQLLLLDMKDLQAVLQYVGEQAKALQTEYGNISAASVGAIQRGLVTLGQEGGDKFFGEPALNIDDLMQTDANGHGVVNILAADKLIRSPRVYATLLLWLLTELFEKLPEVGDPDKPKLVFFFDEAHLLFTDLPSSRCRQGDAGGAAGAVEGRGRVLRVAESARYSRGGAGSAGQPGAACAAGVYAEGPEGGEGGGADVSHESEARRGEDDHGAGSGRGAGVVSRREGYAGGGGARDGVSAARADRARSRRSSARS